MRKLLALLSLALLWASTAAAQDVPDRARRAVVDEANVIADLEERQLNQRIVDWNRATGHQLVVATIPDLQGSDIADYANTLLRTWGIGRAGANDGVILLLAPNERQVRIEVGYGLEPVLTDALSGQIIEETIRPALRNGDVAGALSAGADRIMAAATMDPADARALTLAAERAPPKRGFPIFWTIVAVVVGGLIGIALLESYLTKRDERRWQRSAAEEKKKQEARLRRQWAKQRSKGQTAFATFEEYYADFLDRQKAMEAERTRKYLERQARDPRPSSTHSSYSPSSSGSSWWSDSGSSGWDSGSSSGDSGFDSGGGSGGGGGADSNY